MKKTNHRRLLTSVLNNIGSNIKNFTMIESSFYDLPIYLELLPNIQTLVLYNMTYDKMPPIKSLSLENLRNMEILCCDRRVTEVLNAFPENVLEKLKVSGAVTPIELFIRNQKTLKNLSITSDNDGFDLSYFKDLKLECFDTDISGNLDVFLQSQPQLQKLTLCELYIEDNAFHYVTQLKLLSKLKIDVERISASAMSGLKHLTNLKSLDLMNMDRDEYSGHITELSRMKNDTLNVLIIEFPYQEVPCYDFIALRENFKKISSINITLKSVTNEHIHPFITSVDTLFAKYWLDFMEDDFYGEFNNFDVNETNLEMKSMNIRGMNLKFENLSQLMTNFPNLVSLALRFDGYVRDEHIEQILIGLPKLQVFRVSRCCRLSLKIVDIIKEHGKHLANISMAGIEDFTKLQFDDAFKNYPQDILFS